MATSIGGNGGLYREGSYHEKERALACRRLTQCCLFDLFGAGKEVIRTEKAPAALGPYSQAIKAGGFLYVSGCLGIYPDTMAFAGDGVEEQTDQLMKNMGEILQAAGLDYSNVVKTTVLYV